MTTYRKIDIESIREKIEYNPATGVFICKSTGVRLDVLMPNGYRIIEFNEDVIPAHRVAFLYVYDVLPGDVDHKDRNRDNNAINNLRSVSKLLNANNKSVRPAKHRGKIQGVTYKHKTKKYKATINIDGSQKSLGQYKCKALAGIVYMLVKEARYEYIKSLYPPFPPDEHTQTVDDCLAYADQLRATK